MASLKGIQMSRLSRVNQWSRGGGKIMPVGLSAINSVVPILQYRPVIMSLYQSEHLGYFRERDLRGKPSGILGFEQIAMRRVRMADVFMNMRQSSSF